MTPQQALGDDLFVISRDQLVQLRWTGAIPVIEAIHHRPLSAELKQERERVLDEAIMEYDKLSIEGWSAWKFKEVLEVLKRGEP